MYIVVLIAGVQQSDSVMCTYASLFLRFFYVLLKYQVYFPVLYSRSLLIICFVYSSVYMLIPNS